MINGMHSKDDLQWLEKNNLLEPAKENSFHFKHVIRNCLGIKGDEQLLIIGDRGYEEGRLSPIIALSYYLAAKELNVPAKLILQEDPKYKGDRADQEVVDALYDFRPGNCLALTLSARLGSIKEISHSFRGFIRENRHRFVSTTSLGQLTTDKLPLLINAMDVDYEKIRKKGRELKQILDNGHLIHVETKAGTDFYMNKKGKKAVASIGNFTEQGEGGNIPIGEVFTPPKWKHAEGTIVIDGSSSYREGTQLIKTPITLTVEKDEIVDIKGGIEAQKLEGSLVWAYRKAKHPWGIKRIGEFGIGINPKARIVGATIIDEKALGTAHFGIGSNYWFGGTIYAIVHYDQIVKNPSITIDDKPLDI
ncbi:aminopeptidase [Candidatus Woesearchaeota archaeon]|nr:aminopeptidase [Candidatus Woesearchaeota archaeon]